MSTCLDIFILGPQREEGWRLTKSEKAKSYISVKLKEKKRTSGEGRETITKSSSERPGSTSEIKRGLSGRRKRNEERQRCEVRGERAQLQTTTEINMT